MNKRIYILGLALIVAYIGMIAYLTSRYPEQGSILSQITFGLALVAAVVLGAYLSNRGSRSRGILRALKVLIASWVFAFAAWMGLSVLVLPVAGFGGFMLVEKQWFPLVLVGGTLVVLPFVARKLT